MMLYALGQRLDDDHFDLSFRDPAAWPRVGPGEGMPPSLWISVGDSVAGPAMQLGCCPATDARPAIALLQSEKPIDLLISDVVLPHISGRKLAELARNLHPHLKVLFVTGYAEQATIRSDFLDVGMDMLAKPFALDALGAKVHAMIQRPPSVA